MILAVALTGGLATGKGFVGEVFAELGCHRLEADRLGHETLRRAGAAFPAVLAAFGREILGDDGEIDRRRLGSIVFPDPARLEQLNAIVHPAVESLRQARIAEIAKSDPNAIVICEAAIYIESGMLSRFDKVVLTVCGRELQIERAMARSGWTRAEAEARIARQWPDEAKRKFADYVIDTSSTLEESRRQTVEVYNCLRGL
ncbi:MAG TPA: dephospho-CoA kinase [Bryobacteraceae bacterium]|nr:dephospho-CoA kinase [Bryobacteraceae bacterium]